MISDICLCRIFLSAMLFPVITLLPASCSGGGVRRQLHKRNSCFAQADRRIVEGSFCVYSCQFPSAQNYPYGRETYFDMTYSESLQYYTYAKNYTYCIINVHKLNIAHVCNQNPYHEIEHYQHSRNSFMPTSVLLP